MSSEQTQRQRDVFWGLEGKERSERVMINRRTQKERGISSNMRGVPRERRALLARAEKGEPQIGKG